MKCLRVGTRASKLALWQTRWVIQQLKAAHRGLDVQEIVITTHGDKAVAQPFDHDWPVGGFVGAIEQALEAGHVDFAVHSYKDLQTAQTPGLVVAAVPERAVAHDVLVTNEPVNLSDIPAGFRLGTSSPRRAAQFRRTADVEIVPLRGAVPTRIEKLTRENLDGIVLAAAGLIRLGLSPPHVIDLPVDQFVPAPAQGALAIQTRADDNARALAEVIDHEPSHRVVRAERSFLTAIGAGCHTPVGALATIEGDALSLSAQLFDDAGERMSCGIEIGSDPIEVGQILASRLLNEMEAMV